MFSRLELEQFVRQHKAERHACGYTCWGQFIAMLFCQLGQAQSLREICGGLACCEGKIRHLGVPGAPQRSTLAYANEHRPSELYQSVFQSLYQRCQREAGQLRRFRFRNPLVGVDATLIDPCASLYDWAKYQRTKGAVKLPLKLRCLRATRRKSTAPTPGPCGGRLEKTKRRFSGRFFHNARLQAAALSHRHLPAAASWSEEKATTSLVARCRLATVPRKARVIFCLCQTKNELSVPPRRIKRRR